MLPRDQDNGLEDKANKTYSYWDGRILKAADGKFHMFASRWNQSAGHNGWFGSSCVHAVSDANVLGPYVDKGPCYGDASGQGHNVMASQLPDGRYFILVSETRRPAIIYTSTSLDGPWTKAGTITTEANGYPVDASSGSNLHSNTTMWVRPDGSILATSRDGVIMLSTNGILGPYKVQSTSVYDSSIRYPAGGPPEDPVLWYSGCQYHIVYSYPLDRKSYHLVSPDGIKNWVNVGLAFDATKPFIKYADGTVNTWNKLERPQVYLEDGHVKYFSLAAIDVDKGNDVGNDNHNSKVIVLPFDGVLFDQETGLAGCTSGTGGAAGGTGGRGGSGGGSGGPGGASGGTSGRGGSNGSGGGSGGSTAASGGAPASGGVTGSGGSTTTDAAVSTSGRADAGGLGGRGGQSGATGSGGTTSPGGAPETGGATSSGGAGGSTPTGGNSATGSGGSQSIGSGGAIATGGQGGTATTAAGGASGGGGTALSPDTSASGCACSTGAPAERVPVGATALLLAALAWLSGLRRRRS